MRKFKTESKRLLDLMINSIYTNREIFLRELVSNASDALDKLYIKSLTDSSVDVSRGDLHITVAYDKDARTITVSDNGIGMDKEDLEKNLGTIAHSGSLEFKSEQDAAEAEASDAAKAADEVDIIGQFGVGFYSAFMVASKVEVFSKAYGADTAYSWVSDGIEGYTISETEKEDNGTDIVMHLKENTAEDDYDTYLSDAGLQGLIKRYSNYVRYPIKMTLKKTRELPKPEDAGDDYVPQYEDYEEVETVNSMTPIWKKRKSQVSQEEYDEFYKSTFHDYADPARTVSVHAEGSIAYDVLLFVPDHAPFDLYSKEFKRGLSLYSSNVLIMEKCEELLPDYFGFVRGIVDSQDLSLNISRETLQHNSQLHAIANKVEKKIKSELVAMCKDDRETYEAVFKEFGRVMKYGLYSSYGMKKDVLADLLLFYSAQKKKLITFDEYLADAGEDAGAIFYAAGDSLDRLAKMPVVTSVLAKGHDVLLCTDAIDEFCLSSIHEYNEHELKNVAAGDLGLETDDEKSAAEEATKKNQGLFDAMKEGLEGKVSKVAVSTRLTDAPVCITTEGPVSLEMEKLMAGTPDAENVKSQRVLEINPAHEIFNTLKAAQEAGDTQKVKEYTGILYDQALLAEGMPIDDPVAFAQAVCKLMK